LARLVFKKICSDLAVNQTSENLDRFLSWVIEDNTSRILFEQDLKEYAHALLSPYANMEPEPPIKKKIQSFLIDHFGDPRIKRSDWQAVSESTMAILARWLTEESFEFLLKIVSKTNDTTQWVERKKFWSKYIKNGSITEAWVVLGPRAAVVAQQMKREGKLESTDAYGILRRDQIDPFHSVILMRIGDWIISEWTHSGKVRFYKRTTNQHTPKMYEPHYSPSRIRADDWADECFVHHHLSWTDTVERYLRNKVGVSPATKVTKPSAKTASDLVMKCKGCEIYVAPRLLNSHDLCPKCRGVKYKKR
jgi:hypothetical protein